MVDGWMGLGGSRTVEGKMKNVKQYENTKYGVEQCPFV